MIQLGEEYYKIIQVVLIGWRQARFFEESELGLRISDNIVDTTISVT